MTNIKIVARPWQPQDLIDDLQEIIDEECDNYLNTRRTTLCMALDFLKEHFAEQKWIPVTERLPEEFGFYLTARKRDVFVEQWNGVCFSQRCHHAQPTHWMPLPEPPKGD
jgi:hypothetical protein